MLAKWDTTGNGVVLGKGRIVAAVRNNGPSGLVAFAIDARHLPTSHGLETAWRLSFHWGQRYFDFTTSAAETSSPPGQETVRSVAVLLEVCRVPTGVALSMFRKEHARGVIRPPGGCCPHVGGTKPDGQPVLTDCAADILNEPTHAVEDKL